MVFIESVDDLSKITENTKCLKIKLPYSTKLQDQKEKLLANLNNLSIIPKHLDCVVLHDFDESENLQFLHQFPSIECVMMEGISFRDNFVFPNTIKSLYIEDSEIEDSWNFLKNLTKLEKLDFTNCGGLVLIKEGDLPENLKDVELHFVELGNIRTLSEKQQNYLKSLRCIKLLIGFD